MTIMRQMTQVALIMLAGIVCAAAEPGGYQIVERMQDSATYQRVIQRTNDAGEVTIQTNQLCVLDHGMHYLENGEYKESKDLIESFADGAIARFGAYRTIFSPELNVPAVFDISDARANRIRGGVRAIHLTDIATGNSVVVGTVKNSVGEIIPPNQIVFRSAFDGLEADVLYVWKHNAFCQNVIIRENIGELPAGFARATTRLESVTELVETPEVQITGQILKQPGKPDLVDDGLISFGQMLAVPGLAFPVAGEDSVNLTGPNISNDKAVPVLKQWRRLEDGRTFVIESVAWDEIEPLLKDLRAQANNSPRKEMKVAQSRVWPNAVTAAARHAPMQVASVPYRPIGYLVDLELLSGSASSKTFYAGTTYYIPSFYSVTSSSTFQGGATIKLGPSATLSLSGSFTSPTTGVATLTSRDDDTAGEQVVNAGNPPYTSDGVVSASDWSNAALSLYNGAANITVYRFRVRYASRAISDYSPYYTHTVHYCRMENCGFGVYAYYTTVNMTNNEVCSVATNAYASTGGYISQSGTMTECGPLLQVASFAGLKQEESGTSPPDTMGAVGPNHFVTVLNGEFSVAVYGKYSGIRLSPTTTTLDGFFSVTVNSGPHAATYPTGRAFDPRIIYDHGSQRWIATALDNGSRHALLAVSNTNNPIGNGGSTWVSDNWTKYLVPLGPCRTDFDTLGVDSNGIYVSAVQVNCFSLVRIAALPKAPFLNGTAPTVQTNFIFNFDDFGSPNTFPAVNFDPISTNDPAWFIFYAGDVGGGKLFYNGLKWVHGFAAAPEWIQPWFPDGELTITNSFYDLIDGGIKAPQLGSSTQVDLQRQGSRLMMATVRKFGGIQYLWTCHQIGVNSAGNNDNGQADRSAVQWFKIQTTPSVSISASGRIYDAATVNPKFYYMPSLALNQNGDMVVGFSGSSTGEYISAYYWGKLNNGSSLSAPLRYFSGKDWFDGTDVAWGDYSYTSLDPDSLTVWTIQEYAETRFLPSGFANAFGTRISAVTPF